MLVNPSQPSFIFVQDYHTALSQHQRSPSIDSATYCTMPSPSMEPTTNDILSTTQTSSSSSSRSTPSSTSPSISCPSSAPTLASATAVVSSSHLRFKAILEAPTAVTQKNEESPLTYLNKGQYYNVIISKLDDCDDQQVITSSISITFHDEAHRKEANNYWKFWISQQKHVDTARAIDIDTQRCQGVKDIVTSCFDSVSFKWDAKAGATVSIRFNCLSTDFSRIKGVKGIPLRLHMINQMGDSTVEQSYCLVKFFRDKGAERKNKDDARHVEKQLEKMRASPSSNDLVSVSALGAKRSYYDFIASQTQYQNRPLHTFVSAPLARPILYPSTTLPAPPTLVSHGTKSATIGADPFYVPQRRRRAAKLCIFVKFGNASLYRAVYLEELTVKDLQEKLLNKVNMESHQHVKLVRHVANKKDVVAVKMDDSMVQAIPEEQDMQVDSTVSKEDPDGTFTLVLRY
ncbi:CP2-domain-containing protein [Lichtheimia hyalospora FSU 10163]|nr:CP2-domain-containing protein [Lichtheimia hyalospora FSU 10163]